MKRGMNAVVAVVFLILISVVAVGIIWGTVIPYIQGNLDLKSRSVDLVVVTEGGYTVYDPDAGYAFVQIKRGQDDATLHGMEILINFNGVSYKTTLKAIPSGSVRTYLFDLSLMNGKVPDSVSVAPVFLSDAREILGPVTSEVKMPVAKISGNVSDIIIGLNTDGDNTTFPIPIIEGKYEQDFTDCPPGKTPDPWNGCAVYNGTLTKITLFLGSDRAWLTGELSNDWESGHWIVFNHAGSGSVCLTSNKTGCLAISGGSVDPETGFINMGAQDELTVADCANDRYYVYDNPDCA